MSATQSIPQSLSQSKLAVVPFPAPQPITQTELILLLGMRGRLHQLESQVEQAEPSITTRLEKGALLEPGDHRAERKHRAVRLCLRRFRRRLSPAGPSSRKKARSTSRTANARALCYCAPKPCRRFDCESRTPRRRNHGSSRRPSPSTRTDSETRR